MIFDFLKDLVFLKVYSGLERLVGWTLWRIELGRSFRTARGWSPEVVRNLILIADPLDLVRNGEPVDVYRSAAIEIVRLCPIAESCTRDRVVEALDDVLPSTVTRKSRTTKRVLRLGHELYGLHARANHRWHDDSWGARLTSRVARSVVDSLWV